MASCQLFGREKHEKKNYEKVQTDAQAFSKMESNGKKAFSDGFTISQHRCDMAFQN